MKPHATPAATPKRRYPDKQEIPPYLAKEGVFWHRAGGFAKKWDGKHVYYGTDAQAAYKQLLKDLDAREKGAAMPSRTQTAYTLHDASNLFLHRQLDRLNGGEIGDVQYVKYRKECRAACEVWGEDLRLSRLCGDQGPGLFRKLREAAFSRGLSVAERHITYVGAMLDLAEERGLMSRRNDGGEFGKPRPEQVARQKIQEEQLHGQRAWSNDELRQIVAMSWDGSPRLRAAILLALNCGFGNDDCSLLEWSNIERGVAVVEGDNTDGPVSVQWESLIKAYRGKTLCRRVSPLWPVTLWALDQARWDPSIVKPARPEWADRVFLTREGKPLVEKHPKQDKNGLTGVPRTDRLADAFEDLLESAKPKSLRRHKTGFYTLRAMFRSAAVGCGVDNDLIAVIKGQKFARKVDEYYLRGDLRAKLFKVTNHVFDSLFKGWGSKWPMEAPAEIFELRFTGWSCPWPRPSA